MARNFTLRDEIVVHAPLERCFLLSTSVEIVERELGMHPVAGRTSGLVKEGDTVRWEGWQLGLPQFHESCIEEFRPPSIFRDRMIAGRFASFEHDHSFTDQGNGTVLLWTALHHAIGLGWRAHRAMDTSAAYPQADAKTIRTPEANCRER